MSTTLKQTEAIPESYPDLDPAVADAVWQRIESYIAWRWTPRAVVWTVEGPGEWTPPLTPTTISTVEVWSGANAWETATLDASPLGGYYLPATGPYRFTATVGDDSSPPPAVPAIVEQAAQRLAAYVGSVTGTDLATLDEAKEYLRVDHDDEDPLIEALITAASDEVRLLTDESAAVLKVKTLERVAELFDERGAERVEEDPEVVRRNEKLMARAMQNSGAADLLRNYRRA